LGNLGTFYWNDVNFLFDQSSQIVFTGTNFWWSDLQSGWCKSAWYLVTI